MSDLEVHKSFFNKLKETVRVISENLAEIDQEMTTPKCDLPKQSALQKLDCLDKDLNIVKEQAVHLLTDIQARTNQLRSYNANMKELITEMEEKFVNIMDSVKKYGYKPDDVPTTDNQIEHVEENANCIATPGIKIDNGNSKLDKPLERTPLLIDYGLMSTRKSNMKNGRIENSVQKKQVPSQNEFAKMSRHLNSNDFVTPLKQPSIREEKTLPQKLEEILEKTPMIDYSALYKDFTMASDTNGNCTEEFQLRKPLDLGSTESQVSNSTPELPFNSTFRMQNKDKTEEVHVTPELPPSDVIKEAVKQAEKTPELKLSVFGVQRRDKK